MINLEEIKNLIDGFEEVWPTDPTATHAICGCERHQLTLKNDDSHACTWIFLRKKRGLKDEY